MKWLLEHHRSLIDAEFVLNEGGGEAEGRKAANSVQAAGRCSQPPWKCGTRRP
jgi:hypothetical protein